MMPTTCHLRRHASRISGLHGVLNRLGHHLRVVFLMVCEATGGGRGREGHLSRVHRVVHLFLRRLETVLNTTHLPSFDFSMTYDLGIVCIHTATVMRGVIHEFLAASRIHLRPSPSTPIRLIVAHGREPLVSDASQICAALTPTTKSHIIVHSFLGGDKLRLVHNLSDFFLQETVWQDSHTGAATVRAHHWIACLTH